MYSFLLYGLIWRSWKSCGFYESLQEAVNCMWDGEKKNLCLVHREWKRIKINGSRIHFWGSKSLLLDSLNPVQLVTFVLLSQNMHLNGDLWNEHNHTHTLNSADGKQMLSMRSLFEDQDVLDKQSFLNYLFWIIFITNSVHFFWLINHSEPIPVANAFAPWNGWQELLT